MSDWWDDFSNNLATDLGPLISLFGEALTKQYLSECLTNTDVIIFATCPLGILTAVVSVIRVCGTPSLRAFVGRAQEGRGNAEAELCSSTSSDVCELYNNGGIARVFGRPKLLELVQDLDTPVQDFYHEGDETPTAGVYSSQEYFDQKLGNFSLQWKEKDKKISHGVRPDRSSSTDLESNVGILPQKNPSAKRNLARFAQNPNLSLNVGIKHRNEYWFMSAAVLGIALQAFVLIWAVLARYRWGFVRGRSQDIYAVPLTISGTILLCAGMAFCAALIERSTDEREFRRISSDRKSRIYWVQPGNQVIGDQVFDSFCYTHPEKSSINTYTTSWRKQEEPHVGLVLIAISSTILGFVMQFMGLRGCHSSVSVVQLAAMLIMGVVRAGLRTERLKKEDNLFILDSNHFEGLELERLTLEMSTAAKETSTSSFIQFRTSPPCAKLLLTQNDLDVKTKELHGIAKQFALRTRLAEITGAMPSTAQQSSSWGDDQVRVRKVAGNLSRAIQTTIDILFDSNTAHPIGLKESWKKISVFYWTIRPGSRGDPGSVDRGDVYLSAKRDRLPSNDEGSTSSWKVNACELEAALGLWLWSLEDELNKRNSHPERYLADPAISRIVAANPSNEAELSLWRKTGDAAIRKAKFAEPYWTDTLWSRAENGSSQAPSRVPTYEPVPPRQTCPNMRRFFGFHILDLSTNAQEKPFLEVTITGSLLDAAAHELYALFLVSALQMVKHIGGYTIFDRQSLRLVNGNITSLLEAFIYNGLGSSADAVSCIIPALKKGGKLPKIDGLHLRDAIESDVSEETIVQLLDSGIVSDPDAKDQNGLTPLMYAARRGYGKAVKALFATRKVHGSTALRSSVEMGDYITTQALLKTNEVSLQAAQQLKPSCSFLHIAVEQGSQQMVRVLLEHKVPPDEKDCHGWSPLCVAVDKGFHSIVEDLVQIKKVDVEYRFPSVSYEPVRPIEEHLRPEPPIRPPMGLPMRLPMEFRRRCNSSNDQNRRLIKPNHGLMNAHGNMGRIMPPIQYGRPGCATSGLQAQAGCIQRPVKCTSKHLQAQVACCEPCGGPLQVIRTDTWQGYSLLGVAVEKDDDRTVKALLKDGKADPNVRHPDGCTMLSIAADQGLEQICHLLISHGADPDFETELKWRPLGYAAKQGHVAIVHMLLGTGKVDLDSKNGDPGKTALELAEEGQHHRVVRLIRLSLSLAEVAGRTRPRHFLSVED